MGRISANPPKLRVLEEQKAAGHPPQGPAGEQMRAIALAVSGIMLFWYVFLLGFVLCCMWQVMFLREERFVACSRRRSG